MVLVCGPKVATCGIVISIWAVVMLAMLGIFFQTRSAMLIEDVPLKGADVEDLAKVYDRFDHVSYNCFIAAGVYVVVGAFSFCQFKLNKRNEYLVH